MDMKYVLTGIIALSGIVAEAQVDVGYDVIEFVVKNVCGKAALR